MYPSFFFNFEKNKDIEDLSIKIWLNGKEAKVHYSNEISIKQVKRIILIHYKHLLTTKIDLQLHNQVIYNFQTFLVA